MNTKKVEQISECFIQPKYFTEESKNPWHLTPWDLIMISVQYIQKGLLFSKPSNFDISPFLDNLKHSLSSTLVHFYPLAGRLVTSKTENPASYVIFVDSVNSPGARFIHASASDLSISDILSPTYVPLIVQLFFDHDRALNHDGHVKSLLTIQVTELIDGIFIGCSMNHAMGDGTSFWHFFNTFSEIYRNGDDKISRPPILNRWIPDGYDKIISLPFTNLDQFLSPLESPFLKERMFFFSSESIAKLKHRANSEQKTQKISSLQALSAFLWRCITRIRHLPENQVTSCRLACNDRSRLNPPVSENYFGNCIHLLRAFTTAGELLNQNLGWAAWKVHEAVVDQTDEKIREWYDNWMKSPAIYSIGQVFDQHSVMVGSSPRFDKYGNEFGLGKGLAIRSGYAHKFSGKVTPYPGRDGGGSMELEICLPPHLMTALESDEEFLEVFNHV
ncbi:HXXXD-type acyl-transferase family protein [Euphorbia peplus]|nr:HXXXD-type acyl-transferase family protein [Euphorbia peplus]